MNLPTTAALSADNSIDARSGSVFDLPRSIHKKTWRFRLSIGDLTLLFSKGLLSLLYLNIFGSAGISKSL